MPIILGEYDNIPMEPGPVIVKPSRPKPMMKPVPDSMPSQIPETRPTIRPQPMPEPSTELKEQLVQEKMPEHATESNPASIAEEREAIVSNNMSDEDPHKDIVVGMAYVPWQEWQTPYDAEEAFPIGTIFPDLNLPFLGYEGGRAK